MTEITLKDVNLHFPIYGAQTKSLKNKIIHVATGGMIERTKGQVITIHALKNISLSLKEGDRVGLIGPNGAGKSTLLRVLSKIYEPIEGSISIQGKVTSLLNVMLGLDSESTGYENITIRGILHGMHFSEIETKKAEIAAFTELEDYLNMPVRTYSNGMQLRLAFAIATAINPEILILDEIVNVGDAHFLQKAKQRIDSLIQTSKIVVLASHDNKMIKNICNKVIVMQAGELRYFGKTQEGIDYYKSLDYD